MNNNTEFKTLTQKYFWYLVSEYDFVYDESKNVFENNKILIEILQYDRRIPTILLWLKAEPKFTSIPLDRLLEESINYEEIDKFLLEDCFKYFSHLFKQHATLLIENLDAILLDSIKRVVIDIIKIENLNKQNYQVHISKNGRKLMEYIKKRQPQWNPFS